MDQLDDVKEHFEGQEKAATRGNRFSCENNGDDVDSDGKLEKNFEPQ